MPDFSQQNRSPFVFLWNHFRVPLRIGNTSAFYGIRPSMNIADEQTKITTGTAMIVSNTTPRRLCKPITDPARNKKLDLSTEYHLRIPQRFFYVFLCIDHQI